MYIYVGDRGGVGVVGSPYSSVAEPGGHGVQLTAVPLVGAKVPGKQAVHLRLPFAAISPGAHLRHCVEPAGAYVPAGHATQSVRLRAKAPAKQAVHSRLPFAAISPAPHLTQFVEPTGE